MESYSESVLWELVDEGDQNTEHSLSTISSDALNTTQSIEKRLNREIIHAIRPHKKSFNKDIIRHYRYESKGRITTTIGVKTDFFKKWEKRQF